MGLSEGLGEEEGGKVPEGSGRGVLTFVGIWVGSRDKVGKAVGSAVGAGLQADNANRAALIKTLRIRFVFIGTLNQGIGGVPGQTPCSTISLGQEFAENTFPQAS